MNFIVSTEATHSFPVGAGFKPAVLIDASVKKIRRFYSLTANGRLFFSGPEGVEKPQKLLRAVAWLKSNTEVWAPILELPGDNPERFSFAGGRHTFVALEQLGYTCIKVAVPQDRAAELQALLSCDHT